LVTEPGFVEHDYRLPQESHIKAYLETGGEVGYDDIYQTRTPRVIPLVVLSPA
jgi:hypothetical protein